MRDATVLEAGRETRARTHASSREMHFTLSCFAVACSETLAYRETHAQIARRARFRSRAGKPTRRARTRYIIITPSIEIYSVPLSQVSLQFSCKCITVRSRDECRTYFPVADSQPSSRQSTSAGNTPNAAEGERAAFYIES